MSNNDSESDTNRKSGEPDSPERRTTLQALGAVGIGLFGSSGVAAASSHKGNQGQGRGRGQSQDDSCPGKGKWARSRGRGRGRPEMGEGYRRQHPHKGDDTRWDDWEPGDGRPPGVGGGDDGDQDEDEDEDDDDDDSSPGDGTDDDETYELTVTLWDPVNEEPVEGSITATHADGEVDPRTQETDDGEAEFEDLPNGVYDLDVETETEHQHHFAQAMSVNIDGDDVEYPIDMYPPLEEYDVTFTVTDSETGDPIEGAVVNGVGNVDPWSGADLLFQVETDADGTATANAAEGSYTSNVRAEGYENITTTIVFGDDQEEYSYELEPAADEADGPTDEPSPGDGDETEAPEEGIGAVEAQVEQRIHAEVNAYREANGLEALTFHEDLAVTARNYSRRMIVEDFFGHRDPQGNFPDSRFEASGVDCLDQGENLAYEEGADFDPDTDADSVANSVVEAWIESPGHEENLVGEYDSQGIGVAIDTDEDVVMVTQMLCGN